LLGDGLLNRKEWVEDRIEELARTFAVGVGGFSVMDNHLHVRIGCSAERWQVRMEKLKNGRSFGRFFAASRDKLRELAKRYNLRLVVNLVGCAAP
jgi:hypothetical protein